MKIELEVKDLETFAKAFNNALVAYDDIVGALWLGLEPQIKTTKFLPLTKLSSIELDNRIKCLMDVYEQITKLEQGV